MKNSYLQPVVAFCALSIISACGGSGSPGNQSGTPTIGNTDISTGNSSSSASATGDIPEGEINAFGAVTLGDDAGQASDLVASFFELSAGISGNYLQTLFGTDDSHCRIDDDDVVGFEEISAGFIPALNGVDKTNVGAGDTITLTGTSGTYATIEKQSFGAFVFYTLPEGQSLPQGEVPMILQIDVPGDMFPAFMAQILPEVEPLMNFSYTTMGPDSDLIGSSSTFSWTPAPPQASAQNTSIRIVSSTAGGFFLDNSVTVSCVVPDTGTFSFPPEIRTMLGSDFTGGVPMASRLGINTELSNNAALFLIRESFAEE